MSFFQIYLGKPHIEVNESTSILGSFCHFSRAVAPSKSAYEFTYHQSRVTREYNQAFLWV